MTATPSTVIAPLYKIDRFLSLGQFSLSCDVRLCVCPSHTLFNRVDLRLKVEEHIFKIAKLINPLHPPPPGTKKVQWQ